MLKESKSYFFYLYNKEDVIQVEVTTVVHISDMKAFLKLRVLFIIRVVFRKRGDDFILYLFIHQSLFSRLQRNPP